MIAVERFIVPSSNRGPWLAARARGVTATEVAKAATPSGFNLAVAERRERLTAVDSQYMQFGRDHEYWIALDIKRRTGVMPNEWLIASALNPLYLATPDGLSLDHADISEIKTGGTDPGKTIPIQHRRQMQWQLLCTDAARAHYAFMLRTEVNGVYVPAWLEPRLYPPIARDEAMIADLITTADALLKSDVEMAA